MYKQEVAVVLEGLIVKMEDLSRRPAQIEWTEGTTVATSSHLAPLEFRSSTNVRNEFAADVL